MYPTMLDIKFIRENLDLVKAGANKKHVEVDLDRLVEVDDLRKETQTKVDLMRAKQNETNDKIVKADEQSRESLIKEMRDLKSDLQAAEGDLKNTLDEWRSVMVQVPNVPDMSVPDGEGDDDNEQIKEWGKKPSFKFAPKSHLDLLSDLDLADYQRGSKTSGFRGYFLKNDGVILSYALWSYAFDFFMERGGFTPLIAPAIVNREVFVGTGYVPQGVDDLYKTQDGQFFAGTSEVSVMGYHMGEVLDKKDLPKKFLSFSPCYRREAGSHGKDVKGLFRVHEFFKLEQVILCEAEHKISVRHHEEINRNIELFIESLEIPYRTVVNCGGDLGLGQVKKYDVELWLPSEAKYREISSASYFHDFQTRRLDIKYRDEAGAVRFAHSLNSTAISTPRALSAIVENFQQEDGSVKIPQVLQKYTGKDVIKKR
jgi:seryl-tRNA synthetase